ncbi:MAG: VPLPA-CTERM sorting domain-containing protein [Pseudomonadota bacterium]
MTLKKSITAFAAAAMASFGAAQASLVGDEVACQIDPASLWACDTPTAIVGDDVEFVLNLTGDPFFSVDIDGDSVILTLIAGGGLGAGAGELLTLSDLDWVGSPGGAIVGIENFMTDATAGVDAMDVMFLANALMIDLNGTSWSPGQFLSFDLIVDEVPLPAGFILMLSGALGLGAAARKRRSA